MSDAFEVYRDKPQISKGLTVYCYFCICFGALYLAISVYLFYLSLFGKHISAYLYYITIGISVPPGIPTLLLSIIMVVFSLFFLKYALRIREIEYILTENVLTLKAAGTTVNVRLSDIVSVDFEKRSILNIMRDMFSLGALTRYGGEYVTITRTKGLIKTLRVSPTNTQKFAEKLRNQIELTKDLAK